MKLRHLFTREAFIILSLAFIALALNAFVWITKAANTPPGHDFIPIHNAFGDYQFYANFIRQGISGETFVFDRYAVEPHAGNIIHYFYLVLGWLGGLTGIRDANLVYHLSRYILGAFWAMTIYWLIETVVREKWLRIAAFFFALFSASFPIIGSAADGLTVSWYMKWWTELDPVARSAFVPHFLVGHIMMVAAIVSLLHYARKPARIWLVRAGISAWIAGFVHPVSYVLLLMVLPIYVLIVREKRWIIGTLIVLIAGGLGVFVVYQAANAYPWNLDKQLEGSMYAISLWEYIVALGPVVILAVVGFLARYKRKETWLFVVWIATSLIVIPLSRQMPLSPFAFIREHAVSNIRFLQTALWVPLSVLGAYGLAFLWSKWGKAAGLTIVILFALLTFIGYPASISEQIHTIYFSTNYMYPKAGYLKAMRVLDTVTKPNQAILSLWLAGMTIPVYVDRTTYLGYQLSTPQIEVKKTRAWQFFHGDMSLCDAYKLLLSNHIGAVFYSFDEQNAGDAVRFYPFLQSWNTYGDTELFTFVDSPPPNCQYP